MRATLHIIALISESKLPEWGALGIAVARDSLKFIASILILRLRSFRNHKSFIPSKQLLNIFLLSFWRIRKKNKSQDKNNTFRKIVIRRQKDEQEKQISPLYS